MGLLLQLELLLLLELPLLPVWQLRSQRKPLPVWLSYQQKLPAYNLCPYPSSAIPLCCFLLCHLWMSFPSCCHLRSLHTGKYGQKYHLQFLLCRTPLQTFLQVHYKVQPLYPGCLSLHQNQHPDRQVPYILILQPPTWTQDPGCP